MALNMKEALENIDKLRKAAVAQQEAYDAGKSKNKPSIKPGTFDTMEKMVRNMNGDFSKGRTTVSESLMSTDTIKLIPKVIEGQLREAAEPELLSTRFMNTIHVEGGASTVFVIPVVGELRASEVSEGGRYNEDSVDINTIENGTLEVRVKKIGLKVSITEEAISDSGWDIYGINVRKMGTAMGRYKDQWGFQSFSTHGHVIFDNALREQVPEAGTTGRDSHGDFNDTLSTEDFLDLSLAIMGEGMNPTDVIMHPLCWTVFARNSMIGNGLSYGALGGQNVHPWGATQGTPGFAGLQADIGPQKIIMRPEDVQGRLPMPMTINFSHNVRFDKQNKNFDMYIIDRANVGVIVEKEALTTDNWTDPERDIRLLKVKERYGIGIVENGKGISVARNIALAPTYPVPPTVNINATLPEGTTLP